MSTVQSTTAFGWPEQNVSFARRSQLNLLAQSQRLDANVFYIILLIAGVVLAANRKQQASTAATAPATVAQSDTVMLPHFTDLVDRFFNGADLHHYPLPTGPGIGAALSANNPSVSNVIVSGPTIYRPDKGTPPAGAPASAPGGGGTSGGTTPSGSGSGGTGPGVPTGPRIFNTL